MPEVDPAESRHRVRSLTYGIAAITVAAVVAAVPVQGTAWAESPTAESTSNVTDSAPAKTETDTDTETDVDAAPVDEAPVDEAPVEDESPPEDEVADEPVDDESGADEPGADEPADDESGAETEPETESGTAPDSEPEPAADSEVIGTEPDSQPRLGRRASVVDRPEHETQTAAHTDTTAIATLAPAPALIPAVATTTTIEAPPNAPKPLSPLAKLLQLPGRIVNAFLQTFGFSTSAGRPGVPNGLGPINDLIFGAFRELERLLGLHRTPPPQPEVPTLVYDGPTTEKTPTVAQLLNASAAGYVLGSTPAGLVPFTVNGFQMSSTNIFSGMVAKTWVTPEGQIIIAYQGTTGGSNLLFNPLITISQVLADLQVVFTRTTPWAFHDALYFAKRVQIRAAEQGYTSDDIFVTGHSLGGWEAQYVAQQIGLAGIGFEAPGINTRVPGNGVDSKFVNIGTYGSSAPYMATDLPGLQPFMPPFVPGGGSKPHYGPIVMVGDPAAMTPLYNASALWGKGLIGSTIFLVDYLMNFFQYHLPGVQAYHLDVTPDPGVMLFLGTARGPVHTGYGALTIPQLMKAASDDGILFRP
ncbi:hypothetical protein [Mycolicibacterium vaccae]|uniref:Uncharacterized protein n=1 Tax=Mycolicibacterium vaccae ATCC 25954 TaxID=1194972 RepID=K0UQW0_MYCVA|nr:hypothetical protein [Mycolicibacterium vaccae]ANI37706.1 hypothetical protein MYVA_0438 [Mycolicibacterium vaccae 95051]EJZ09472.1 hypothetical protein MVAC_12401 [Mycolicibacterium vaccae ATCC 25954]